MKRMIPGLCTVIVCSQLITACSSGPSGSTPPKAEKPVVKENGSVIELPADSLTLHFFKTATVAKGDMDAALSAPARVVATVVRSKENPEQHLVLFDNPDLTANYTALLQHVISIRQKQAILQQKQAIASQKDIEVKRFSDLASHGAGTGKDVADAKTDLLSAQSDRAVAETDLFNEKTSVIEHEAKLKLAGFDPESLLHAQADKVWLICDVPENLVMKIHEGSNCTLRFTAYPDETFNGLIEDVGEVIDNTTRMVKLRIGLQNPGNRLRAGMFADVQFGVSEGITISVPKSAMVTVQGKNYVFVKSGDRNFIRKEVMAGPQVNDRILIYRGVNEGDAVVTDGAMQLKGISFGY